METTMNCTCPESMSSQEHSPECYLRNRIREDKITIDAFAKESLQDREKIRRLEEALEWICPECNTIYPRSAIKGINLIAECGHVVMTKELHIEKRLADVEKRAEAAAAVVEASRRLHCDLIPNHYAECETPACGGACEDAIVKAIEIYDAARKE